MNAYPTIDPMSSGFHPYAGQHGPVILSMMPIAEDWFQRVG